MAVPRFAAARASLLAVVSLGFAMLGAAEERGPTLSSSEDIYVVRSIREGRLVRSNWCTPERAGSLLPTGNALEERFGLWSVQVEPETGQITDGKASKVGEIRTCSAASLDPQVLNFYAEGRLGELPFTGNGDCHVVEAEYRKKGIATYRCYLGLRGMPSKYEGGLATSNTIVSEAVLGGETDPPGYMQTSIATFRLWRAVADGVERKAIGFDPSLTRETGR